MRILGERGAAGIYVTLLLTFVLFGFMVLAVDVGRLYVAQAELQTAVDSAALSAATRLVGTGNAILHASDQIVSNFDNTDANDNRFDLRMNQLGAAASGLPVQITLDYFATLADAQGNTNGGQAGPDAKYVRVQVDTQVPVIFTRFLSANASARQNLVTAAVAGISAPMCTACGIEPLAIAALDATDLTDYGLARGGFYTLYLNQASAPARLQGTTDNQALAYALLSHLPPPEPDFTAETVPVDELIFRMGAGGMSIQGLPDVGPRCVSIGSTEVLQDLSTTTRARTIQDLLCGMNTRFGIDPTGIAACTALLDSGIVDVSTLGALYAADSDASLGTSGSSGDLQDYPIEYDGNSRRVITMALVDSLAALTVLNFAQFLIEDYVVTGTATPGLLGPTGTPGAGVFRAQYIGRPVPMRSGNIGGPCLADGTVTTGLGRVVLH